VLSAHLKDGWQVVKAIHGYLQHDPESANWAAVIQWINPDCPPPAGSGLTDSAARGRRGVSDPASG
jgi:hypothetical protein